MKKGLYKAIAVRRLRTAIKVLLPWADDIHNMNILVGKVKGKVTNYFIFNKIRK